MGLIKMHPKILWLSFSAVVILLLLPFIQEGVRFYLSRNYLGFHIILEMISIITSFSIFILGWKMFKFNNSSRLLLLSITFLMVGSIDFFHTLSFKGMPFFITESSVAKATWLWVIARTLFSFLVLVTFSYPERRISTAAANKLLYGAVFSTIIYIFCVFKFEDSLPVLAIDGKGLTPLKNAIEYFISLIYLVLIYFSYRSYKNQSNFYSVNIILSLIFMLLSELNFTMYLSVYDIYNFYGHVLKAIATYFIFKAFYFATIEQRTINEKKVIETKTELSNLLKLQDGMIFKFHKEGESFVHSICEGELLEKLNYKGDWIIGKTLEDLNLVIQEEIQKHYNAAWDKKRKINFEFTFQNRHLFVLLKPLLENDEVTSVIGTITDVTDIKKMEMAILNSEKLGTVGELAAGVAHELRNPLTTLKGFLQLMKPDMSDNQKKYVELMLSEVNRLETITQEFMAVAKPQASHFKPECINFIVEDVVRFLIPQAVLQGVEIHYKTKVENCKIKCDSNQLKQVWINLIKNALEAMPGGGNIFVVISQSDPAFLTLEIKDEGSGMPAEVLEKLGQPFFTSKEGGHGLGIMMTKKIIDAHQGTMKVQSKVGVGTTFTIQLPCIKEEQKNAS